MDKTYQYAEAKADCPKCSRQGQFRVTRDLLRNYTYIVEFHCQYCNFEYDRSYLWLSAFNRDRLRTLMYGAIRKMHIDFPIACMRVDFHGLKDQ